MSGEARMSQERMQAVRHNLESFKFCASWFHNLLDEAQRLTRELATLREQRDRLREALSRIATVDDLELPPRAVAMRAESIARTALAQTDEKGGV